MYQQSLRPEAQWPTNQFYEMLAQPHHEWQEQRRQFHEKLTDFYIMSPKQRRLNSLQLREDFQHLSHDYQLLQEHFTQQLQAAQRRIANRSRYEQEPAHQQSTSFFDQFPASSVALTTTKVCLLIVISDQRKRDQLRDLLLPAGFAYTVFASTGSDALHIAKVMRPDAQLIASHLPDMSSLDLYDRLCSIVGNQSIPTLFLIDHSAPIAMDDKPGIRCIDLSTEPDHLLASIHELLLLQQTS